jgi:hypothetical protein
MINMHCCGVSYNLFKRILDLAECSGTSLLQIGQLRSGLETGRTFSIPI